jgi:predicted RNase H-like HicB family nuclease
LVECKFTIAKNGSFGDILNMKRQFNVVIERDAEGYYVATVPDLRGCHTQARSLDKLLSRIREAIELCLEVEDSRRTTSSEFIGLQRVTVEV